MADGLEKMSYNVDEALEIACQIERNGAVFYRKAASLVKSRAAKELFQNLAKQEDSHESIFTSMRKRLVKGGEAVSDYDVDSLVVAYLRAIAGRYVFNVDQEPADLFVGDVSVPDVLRTAIGKEKDSIILYVGMRQAARGPDEKDSIGIILREEQRHLVDLSRMLNGMEGEPVSGR